MIWLTYKCTSESMSTSDRWVCQDWGHLVRTTHVVRDGGKNTFPRAHWGRSSQAHSTFRLSTNSPVTNTKLPASSPPHQNIKKIFLSCACSVNMKSYRACYTNQNLNQTADWILENQKLSCYLYLLRLGVSFVKGVGSTKFTKEDLERGR